MFKKGFYIDYLFIKGLDKILKKVGEELIEVIVVVKNFGDDELIYEIVDLLYYVLVLLVECGVSFDQIK